MSKEYEELKAKIAELKAAVDELKGKMIYNYVDKNMPLLGKTDHSKDDGQGISAR